MLLIGKGKTRQLSDSPGDCPQHVAVAEPPPEFQGNADQWGVSFGGFPEHSMSEPVGLSDHIQPHPVTLQKRRPGPRDKEELIGQWPR